MVHLGLCSPGKPLNVLIRSLGAPELFKIFFRRRFHIRAMDFQSERSDPNGQQNNMRALQPTKRTPLFHNINHTPKT